MNPEVDVFLSKAKKWQEVGVELRKLSPGAGEHYLSNGKEDNN
jgi:hypothetical protein